MGGAVVIDAKHFATAYNSFWRVAIPTCELFVRRLNMDGYERWSAPIGKPRGKPRQALVAESAFFEFAIRRSGDGQRYGGAVNEDVGQVAWEMAVDKLNSYQPRGLDVKKPMTPVERRYGRALARKLDEFFARGQKALVLRPLFPGCGFIDGSEGDVVMEHTLYEVKSVDRMFRGVDIRQLLTYVALNKQANIFDIDRVGIVNPRRGISMDFGLEDICQAVAGKSAEALLADVVQVISSGEMSR